MPFKGTTLNWWIVNDSHVFGHARGKLSPFQGKWNGGRGVARDKETRDRRIFKVKQPGVGRKAILPDSSRSTTVGHL